ncbi:MAG: branched-chain amino acid ABC transporter permease [Candidatus Nanopelagicales bacterium]
MHQRSRRPTRWLGSGFLALLFALIPVIGLASPAQADELELTVAVIDGEGAGIPDAAINITGPDGFTADIVTDGEGLAVIAVPTESTFTLTLDEGTITEGVQGDNPREVSVLTRDKRVIFTIGGDGGGGGGGGITFDRVAQLLVGGIVLSIIIALSALGLSLIFGTTGLTNFAHGELLTLGAFTALVLNTTFGINIIIAGPLAIVLSAALWGWGQNQFLWKPLRRRGTGLIAAMIVSIGLAITIRYLIVFFFGGAPQSFEQFAGQTPIDLGIVFVTPKELIMSVIAIIVLTISVLWLKNSRLGKATRAVSDNPALASASGVNVERVISVVWVLGAGLAALSGVFLGLTQNVVWTMGQFLLLTFFAAVVLGGLGTIGGAIVGSFVVGITVQLSTLIVPTELKTAAALFLMIVLLLVRPQGLLGRRERVG